MIPKNCRSIKVLFLIALFIAGCGSAQNSTPTFEPTPTSQTTPTAHPPTAEQPQPTSFLTSYSFPQSIDLTKKYLFYLHGKIIEDQGIPAIDPDYGKYEYQAILESLSSYGFVIISEQRAKNTDAIQYAERIAEQVTVLMNAGVPAPNITVVGASKGAWITAYVSYLLQNEALNYVILAICHPDVVETFKQNQLYLHGNVLSIYDSIDGYAGSCQELFTISEGRGISKHDEMVLNIGTGHGILYQPLDEWITPTIEWAGKQ